jgi:predicted nucleotidyltransferase
MQYKSIPTACIADPGPADRKLYNRVYDHFTEGREHFPFENIVLCALQGSQNYNLGTEASDVDTKLIVTPKFRDLALNAKPVSTTHVRENDEHIDFKDVRLYLETFRKANPNFLEILFTNYTVLNADYADQWWRLTDAKEQIARMNPRRAVQAINGMAHTKYRGMTSPTAPKAELFAQHGYLPKELHHLVRVDHLLTRYIKGDSYAECLVPTGPMHDFLLELKTKPWPLEKAKDLANYTIEHVDKITNEFCLAHCDDAENSEIKDLLDDVSYNIMKLSVEKEFKV